MLKIIFTPTRENTPIWLTTIFLCIMVGFQLVSPLSVVFGYFLETIVIGIFHLVKLRLTQKYGIPVKNDEKTPPGIGLPIFFAFHYGFFVAIQSIFAFSFFEGEIPEIKSAFNLIANYEYVLSRPNMLFVLVPIILTNLSYFISNFLVPKQYKNYSADQLLFKPYVRIFIQQFAVILGGFFFVMGAHIAAALLILLLRFLVDSLMMNIKRDSNFLDRVAQKVSKTPEQYEEAKQKLQEFSE